MKQRAIFLDRDGVINVNRPDHVKSWDEFVFLPTALTALSKLATRDFRIIVTTNQAAIARGLVAEETVRAIHAQMIAQVERAGGRIDAVYFCPHHPDEKCGCRKPQPGLFAQAARDFEIDLARSFVVGDAFSDVAAALAIGAQPILVMTGRGRAQHAEMIANNYTEHQIAD
ncbi:MAG: D-glycero-beta-D-manno-heptose 1,7-bisphosphate 7-phosphatase, partial [Anaerolineales bacterium]|nr:D-glycero-beta-D-manno-heptose 1,7-bisphosphate 7-phosphatase [Anaerolineales bacterium]